MNKKLLLISMILIVLFSLSAVSASEINGTDDGVGVDSDVLSAPSSVVGASEINGTVDSVGVDSDVLSEPSTSAGTVSMWSDLDDVESADEPQLDINVIYVTNTTFGKDGMIIVHASGDNGTVDGNLKVYLNDNAYEGEFANGISVFNVGSNLNVGVYDIYCEYLGGLNYPSSPKVKSDYQFEVEKGDAVISYTRDGNIFTFTVSNDKATPTGRINVQLGDNYPMTLRLNNGFVTRDFGTSYDSGTYVLNVTYRGDSNFKKSNLVDTIDIIKHNVTIGYNYNKTLFNFNVTSDEGVPTGRITVNFEGPLSVSQSVSLTDGTASYDFGSSLARGTYNLTIKYNGASNFEKGELKDTVTVESDMLMPTITTDPAEVRKLLYQSINYKIIVSGAEGNPVPTGTLYYDDDGNDKSARLNSEGVASINWNNWYDDGIGTTQKYFTYSGDSNYVSVSFVVPLIIDPNLSINVALSGRNATFSFDDNSYCYQGTIYVVENRTVLGTVAGDGGSFPRFTLNDLELGKHNFQFLWDYNNLGQNYTYTKAVSIKEGDTTSQWAVPGFDNQNSGNSNYTRFDNGYIAWDAELNNPYESVIIDSDGYIYISDFDNIKIFDGDGTLVNTVDSGTWGALSLIDDEYLIYVRPWTNIVAWDISTFAGVDTTSDFNNIMYTNSRYSVVKGPDGRYYLSVYFNNGGSPNNGKYVTTLNHNRLSNQITYGNVIINSQPISRVVFDNENIYWVNTVDGVRAVDSTTDTVIFSSPDMGTVGVPVVDENNIAYVFGKENTIYALNAEGIVWNVTVNNGIGSVMAIDNDNGLLYAVSADGTLFSYDTNNQGEATEIYNIGANARGIIVDGNYNVYVGDSNGVVWAFNNEGELLWNVYLGAPVTTQLAMDKNGVIYAVTANKLFALGFKDELSIEVTVPEGEYTVFDNVTITATLSESVEGNITFTVGDLIQVVPINGTTAEWTTTIPSGNQTITATFEENEEYATSTGYTTVTISKVDVGFERVPESVSFVQGNTYQVYFDIVYNGANVTTGSIKGIDENNKQYTSMWRYVNGKGWMATLRNMDAGTHQMTIVYAGDSNYNPANTTFEVVVIPKVTATAEVSDEEVVVNVAVSAADATGNFSLTLNDEVLAEGTIEDGTGSASFDILAPGTYELKVIYEGDGKYQANNGTVSFKIYAVSQWPSVANDPQGTGITNASRNANAASLWDAAIGGELKSSPVIDSKGNVYVTDGLKVYAFSNDGTLLWSTTVGGWGQSPGIALYHDEVIMVPVSGDRAVLLDATTGRDLGGNYWSASSALSPVLGPDGRVYTPSEFGYPEDGNGWSGNNWVSILTETPGDYDPYHFIFVVPVDGIAYMSPGMRASVSIDRNGYVYANTEKGFKIVKIDTNTVVFTDPNINGVGRPVIDANNIAYILDADINGIYAISLEGLVWNTTVTDGIGSTLALDNENGFLYSVNANGTLYKYDINNNGKETLVYDLGAEALSILIDADSNVYVSTDNGNVTAIDSEGSLLWTINVGSSISGQMAMDNNGIIYVVGDNTLYALGYDAELEVSAENLTAADNEIITITVNENAIGNVSVSINGEDPIDIPIEDSTLTLELGQLAVGNYSVVVSYPGDGSFASAVAYAEFEIVKADALIIPDIASGFTDATIILTFPENATGIVYMDIGGIGYYAEIEGGIAAFYIVGLEAGEEYNATVFYTGDDVYNNQTFEIPFATDELLDPELELIVEDTIISVSINENATGMIILTIDDISFVYDAQDVIVLDVSEYFTNGTYDVSAIYEGDGVYSPDADMDSVTIPEIVPLDPELEVSADDGFVIISLNEYASGIVLVGVNDEVLYFEFDGEDIIVDLSDLAPGNYTVEVKYLGDEVFAADEASTVVEIPEIVPLDPELEVSVDGTEVTISLNEYASGIVLVGVNDEVLYYEFDGGDIVVDLSDLAPGTYDVAVEYLGDDVFKGDSANATVEVPEVEPLDPELKVTAENATVTISLNENATGYVLVTLNDDDDMFFEFDGEDIVIDIFFPGNYTVDVIYLGDDTFAPANATVTVEVPEIEPLDPELSVVVDDTFVIISLNENATGFVLVDLAGDVLYYELDGEDIVLDLSILAPGNYTLDIYYSGDDVFSEANTTSEVNVPEIEPLDPNLTATAVNNTITVTVDKDATGNVLVDVDGQGYYAPIKDGKAVVNVIGLDEGKYDAIVTYVGDVIFAPANATVSVTVPKKEDPQPEPVDPKADIKITNETVSVVLPEDATGYVLIDVDDTGYYTTVKDGKAAFDLPELAPGNHTVSVTYTGDKKYTSANATETVTIEDNVPSVIAENLTKIEKAPDKFEALFTDGEGNPLADTKVTFELNGNKYTRTTDANGKAGININFVPGEYEVITTNPVTNESVTNTITVLPRMIGSDLTKYYRNASQYVIQVLDDEGNPVKAGEVVTFNINGVFYNRTSNATGHVKMNINLNPGDYIITGQYKGCQMSNNIKVLPVLTADDLTKKYGEAKPFEVKLVDGTGKAYANQKINFNINGVFYTRTTNSDGIAKLNINLMAGEYIITSTFGDAAISNTVTVTA